jgi:hypothetical protein
MRAIRPLVAALTLLAPGVAAAQFEPLAEADPADVATPEAVVAALYESIQRAPGENYDWDRNLSLFLPTATLIPNTEQTGGAFVIHSPIRFMEVVDSLTVIGGPGDKGFAEEQITATVERFGDIAHVFSTYQKHFWDDPVILGRGINSIQLVHHDGRWWITAIVWDEEAGAGPLPADYLP